MLKTGAFANFFLPLRFLPGTAPPTNNQPSTINIHYPQQSLANLFT
jgi:hypothetical protein